MDNYRQHVSTFMNILKLCNLFISAICHWKGLITVLLLVFVYIKINEVMTEKWQVLMFTFMTLCCYMNIANTFIKYAKFLVCIRKKNYMCLYKYVYCPESDNIS